MRIDLEPNILPGWAHENRITRADPPKSEPSLKACAQELLGYLYELDKLQEEARAGLLVPGPEPVELHGDNAVDSSMEAILRRACTVAACLVGEARTINGKLIG